MGDWKCVACSNHNKSFRTRCNNQHCKSVKFKNGDWLCPRCHNHDFAKRQVCAIPGCSAAKPWDA